MTVMTGRAKAREATLGLSTGTFAWAAFACVVVAICCAAVTDGALAASILRSDEAARGDARSLTSIVSAGNIDGRACAGLGLMDRVTSVLAVRRIGPRIVDVHGVATRVTAAEVSGGLVGAIDPGGVMLAAGLAADLGVRDAGEITIGGQRWNVNVVDPMPYEPLSRDIVVPVVPVGRFDTCVVRRWPPAAGDAEQLRRALVAQETGIPVEFERLSEQPSPPGGFEAAWDDRWAEHFPSIVAAAGGAVAAFVSIRRRRVEWATHVTCGIGRSDVLAIAALELLGSFLVVAPAAGALTWGIGCILSPGLGGLVPVQTVLAVCVAWAIAGCVHALWVAALRPGSVLRWLRERA